MRSSRVRRRMSAPVKFENVVTWLPKLFLRSHWEVCWQFDSGESFCWKFYAEKLLQQQQKKEKQKKENSWQLTMTWGLELISDDCDIDGDLDLLSFIVSGEMTRSDLTANVEFDTICDRIWLCEIMFDSLEKQKKFFLLTRTGNYWRTFISLTNSRK